MLARTPTPFAVAFSHAHRELARQDAIQRRLRRSATGRRLAAQAAARLLGQAPCRAPLEVEKDERGRPWLLAGGAPSDIDVSISHSGDCVVAAAARGMRIGIDVEPLDGVPDARTWRYFLTDREIRGCEGRPWRALWTWMIKEAAYKAMDAREPLNFKQMAVHDWESGIPKVSLGQPGERSPLVVLHEHRGFAIAVVLSVRS